MNQKLFDDFIVFSKKQLESGDIDPMYPVLESVFNQRKYDEEQKLWYLFLYTTFYHVGSAEIIFERFPKLCFINKKDVEPMPTGIERRGFRGNTNWVDTIDDLSYSYSSMVDFISPIHRNGMPGWKGMRVQFETLRNNGPWSSYKFADLLAHVMHYDIEADDLGNNPAVLGCAETLTGIGRKTIERTVSFQNELFQKSLDAGIKFSGLDQLETCLCDFHSVLNGHYYVGHDIDMNMKQIPDKMEFWKAREESFESKYLGEKNAWSGERRELKRRYLETGEI